MIKPDLAIIGAGAAGLLAASCGSGKGIVLLEAGKDPGRKLAAAGGGRANFANIAEGPQFYICENHFCAHALRAFPREALLNLLTRYNLAWEIRNGGKYFLKCPAGKLVDALGREFMAKGGRIFVNNPALRIAREGAGYIIHTGQEDFFANNILLTAGGPAAPSLGGSFSGFELAKSLGHQITPPAPALVPLLWKSDDRKIYSRLAGVGVTAEIGICPASTGKSDGAHPNVSFCGDILFTHKGLSGPAVLNISLYWRKEHKIWLNFLPGRDFEKLLDENEKGRRSPRSLLSELLPQRLADCLLPANIAREAIARIGRRERHALGHLVNRFTVQPKCAAGFESAEICRGGIKTGSVNPHTLESLIQPGLFFAGEILDVAGQLGGYNLAWAFASGYCAAEAAGKRLFAQEHRKSQ